MTKKTCAAALACWLVAIVAVAQTGEQTLRVAVIKQQHYLRNFSADARVKGHWDAASNALVMDQPQVRTMATFIASSVKIKGAKVEIRGDSQIVERDSLTKFAVSPSKSAMVIELNLQGADMNTVLPQLADLLFYPDLDHARAGIPEKYRKALPMKANAKCCEEPAEIQPLKHRIDGVAVRKCDCADVDKSSCVTDGDGKLPEGVKPPRVTYTVDPEFSEEARNSKFSGNVQVALEVGVSGRPDDIWIIRGVGMGLDAKAAQAVSQYKFSPATCHGNPIQIDLYIDVNFQIF
jgi:TonB family protein